MSSEKEILPERKSVRELLTNYYFQIPLFQRDYCWEIEKWEDFWGDITTQMVENYNFFLGSIVVKDLKEDANFEIIDGQQRITTIIILLATIRDEYEHNMSQQLYISNNTWELVKTAKEDVVRLINSTAAKFNPDDDAGKFAQDIITDGFNSSNNPIDKALISLKEDVRENFA